MVIDLAATQDEIFVAVAENASEFLPLNITLTAAVDDVTLGDVQDLQKQGLIAWDFFMKSSPWMGAVTNPEHIIKCVAYYGDAVSGYYCAGYAIGCISTDKTAVEINFIEKRKDASADLRYKFLPIIVDAFLAYGLYLTSEGFAEVDKFVLIGPVEGVKKYYKEQGFTLIEDYSNGTEAMLKYMDK
ncbi:hypothetical protein [Thaumasiovibrio sp. DFM-14]|uniref:hypothetical protein n=1 Tax=Thaumasiovibrio sp. DFM-14 TaxID=3384792 RepID=UPI0039A0DD48